MSDPVQQAPEKYGEPLEYDPEFRGPRKRRSCTDILCLFFFTGFVVAWILIGLYAFKRGDPERILKPTDSNGRRCGVDSEVLSKPYLFFFDIAKCADPTVILNGCNTPQVCIEKCPDHEWSANPYLTGQRKFDLNDVRSNLICINDESRNYVKDVDTLKSVIDQNRCALWYTTSYPSLDRCLPHLNQKSLSLSNLKITDPLLLFENVTLHIKSLAYSQEVGTEIFDDLSRTWRVIFLAFGIAIVFSLVYISLLRWVAGILTWLSILAVIALLITGTIFSYQRYDYLKINGPPPVKNKMIIGTLEEWSYKPELWIVLTVILGIAAVIIFLLVIFLRKRITIAITLIKEGSKAVSSIITSLFFPIIPWIFQCIVAVWVLAVLCFLMSIGKDTFIAQGMDSFTCICQGEYQDLKTGAECDPARFQTLCKDARTNQHCTSAGCHYFKQQKEDLITYFEVFNIFGFFWGIWFVSGLSQMILAGSFASWYWTFDKRDVPFFVVTASVGRTIRYHLGTVAFGSLIISICSFIRAVIEYTEKKLKKFDNGFVNAIFCCCKCFFWCLERFLKFLNRNAYIMCAIHGKNFCSSAGQAFNLLMRNAIRVVVLDKVTDFVFFIGKLVITGCMVAGSYYLFIRNTNVDLHYNGATPLVVIAIGSYIIASIFFGVYQMAVDTLFLCFLEDCERNDGTPQKPYFMSKNLMKILGKKNKKTD